MATEVGQIYYDLDVKTDTFHSKLKAAQNSAEDTGTKGGLSFGKLTGAMALGNLAASAFQSGIGMLGDALKGSVTASEDHEKAMSQLGAVLQSTGGKAGITADEVDALSNKMMYMTGIDDEAITGLQSMLLTFTSLNKTEFPGATQAVMDWATAMNGGALPGADQLRQTTIQLGKALQDPDKGLGALHRVGVNTDELAKKFVGVSDVATKQRLILAELATEFGGSSKAAGQTFAGQLAIAKQAGEHLKEGLGNLILGGLRPLLSAFDKWFLAVGGADGMIKMVTESFNKFNNYAIQPVVKAFNTYLLPSIQALSVEFQKFWQQNKDWLIPTLDFLAKVIVGVVIVAIWAIVEAFRIIIAIIGWVADTVKGLIQWFNNFVTGTAANMTYLKNHFWEVIGEIIGFFLTLPLKVGIAIGEMLANIWNKITTFNWGGLFRGMWVAFENACGNIVNSMGNAFHYVTNLNWGSIVGGIGKGIGNSIIGLINGGIKGAFSGVPILRDHIPQIPYFAEGVRNFAGGLAVVGENGAELVNLPQGSDVYKHGTAPSTTTANFSGDIYLGDQSAVDAFFARLSRNEELARKGFATI